MAVIMTEDEAIDQGIELFNAGKFFEAHEAWEPLWLETVKPMEKKFLQGLIMAAGSFYHYMNHACTGASILLLKSKSALESTKFIHPEIRINEFLNALEELRSKFEACLYDVPISELPKIVKDETLKKTA